MRLLGLGFANLFSRKKADVEVLTTISSAAGDAMLDSAGVLSLVGAWPAGKGTVQVPDVAGKPWDEAQEAAAAASLVPKLADFVYDPKVGKGAIVSQEIPAGTKVAAQTAVDVTVSMGQRPWNCRQRRLMGVREARPAVDTALVICYNRVTRG